MDAKERALQEQLAKEVKAPPALTPHMMTVTLNGETLSIFDDFGIRAHSVQRAMQIWKRVPRLKRERAFIQLFAGIHFVTIKLGGMQAFHELVGDKAIPLQEMQEMMTVLRALCGEHAPQVTREIVGDVNPGNGESGDGTHGSGERSGGLSGQAAPDAGSGQGVGVAEGARTADAGVSAGDAGGA